MIAPVEVFVDTNVLIYARDRRDAEKRDRSSHWLTELGARSAARVNLQVLNELTRWILRKEPESPLSDVREDIDLLRPWGDKPIDSAETELAWIIRAATGYQWFDCPLLAAADSAGCSHFLSEDMDGGRTVGSVLIVNPFQTSPSDILPKN